MPRFLRLCVALFIAAATLASAPPAQAVTSTTVIVTDDGQPVPRTSIHHIDLGTGAEIPQETGTEGACGIAFELPAGTYRVLVGNSPVGDFSVTGEGQKQVASDLHDGRKPDCRNTKRHTRPAVGRGDRDDRDKV